MASSTNFVWPTEPHKASSRDRSWAVTVSYLPALKNFIANCIGVEANGCLDNSSLTWGTVDSKADSQALQCRANKTADSFRLASSSCTRPANKPGKLLVYVHNEELRVLIKAAINRQ